METFSPHSNNQDKTPETSERDPATKKLDEEMAKYYGIPIESARELGSELEADALRVATETGIGQRALSGEQLDSSNES